MVSICRVTPVTQGKRSNIEIDNTSVEVADFETALDMAGYGRFSNSVAFACAGSFFMTGVQNALSSYVLPAAGCELQLSTYRAALVNVAFMSGGVASAFFWGLTADVLGRKRTLMLTLILDAVVTLAQSSVQEFHYLVAARAINGFLIGGPSTLVMTYLSDLVGKKRRPLFLNLTGMSFTLAWLLLPAVAWVILPYKINNQSWLTIDSWRLYLVVCSLPGFVSGLWVLFLPESPRYLLDTERAVQAREILARIYSINTGKPPGEYPVKKLLLDNLSPGNYLIKNQTRSKMLLLDVMKQMRCLLSKTYIAKTSLISFIFFANMAAGFGLSMWIPELLVRMKMNKSAENPFKCGDISTNSRILVNANLQATRTNINFTRFENSTMNPYMYNHLAMLNNSLFEMNIPDEVYYINGANESKDNVQIGNFKEELDAEVYISGLLVGACCVLGNIACACICSLGARGVRRAASACAIVCAGACFCVCACVCSCAGNGTTAVAAVSTLNAAALNGNVLLLRLLLHALPPKLSALGVCWGAWWGRAGGLASNMAIGALLDVSCAAPFIAVGSILALSAVGIMMVKESNHEQNMATLVDEGPNVEESHKEPTLDKYITTHM